MIKTTFQLLHQYVRHASHAAMADRDSYVYYIYWNGVDFCTEKRYQPEHWLVRCWPGGAKELSPRGEQLLSPAQRAIITRGVYEPEPTPA